MSLYLSIDLLSISIPFLFSFHPKIQFYKEFKSVFIGLVVSGLIYLSWDIVFTQHGVWGFNADYLMEINLFFLPIEEWLFFISIPFACIFTYFCFKKFYPNLKLSEKTTKWTSIIVLIGLALLAILNFDKSYTSVNAISTFIILIISILINPKILSHFYISFLVILIPFFIVNGVLTGSFIENEVVWYNDIENLGIRIWTIPIEDSIYAFGMILLPISIHEYIAKKNP